MKKIIALLLAVIMVFAFVACNDAGNTNTGETNNNTNTTDDTNASGGDENNNENNDEKNDENTDPVVTPLVIEKYEDFVAAELETLVTVETYIQARQSWWDGKATFYTQTEDGGYFLYELPCSEEEFNEKLVPGAKIRVTGYKAAWAGELEIIDVSALDYLEGTYVAEPIDLTDKLGTEELINYQNRFAAFNGLTVKNISYKNGEPGDDIYLTLGLGEAEYSFCVEVYLTGTSTDVYTTVGTLEVGDIVNVEGFVYWYEGVNPHITSIVVAE